MYRYLSLIGFVLCMSCNRIVDINGHWHIELENQLQSKYLTIDIADDTLAILEKNSIFGEIRGDHDLVNQQLIFPGECGMFHFKYELVGDELFLESQIENWVGKKIKSSCSNSIKDIVKDFKLEVELPKIESRNESIQTIELSSFKYIENIVVGNSNTQILKGQIIEPVLNLDGKISKIEDLMDWIGMKRKRVFSSHQKFLVYRIFADENVKTKELERIIKVLKIKNINNYYIAFLKIDHENSEPSVQYLHLDQIDLDENKSLVEIFE